MWMHFLSYWPLKAPLYYKSHSPNHTLWRWVQIGGNLVFSLQQS